jgi:hypothetical protein
MSAPNHSLIQQDENQPLLIPDMKEKPELFSKHGQFSGDQVFKSRPDVYRAVVKALGEGMGMRAITRAYGVSHHTVMAIRDREGLQIATIKQRTSRDLRAFASIASERLIEEMEHIPLQSLPVAIGIAIDKAQLLDGEVTSIIGKEEKRVTPDDFNDYLKTIEAQVLETVSVADEESPKEPLPESPETDTLPESSDNGSPDLISQTVDNQHLKISATILVSKDPQSPPLSKDQTDFKTGEKRGGEGVRILDGGGQ